MGRNGYLELLKERKHVYSYFKQQMETLAANFGEKVIATPSNQISIAMTLDSFTSSSTTSNKSFTTNSPITSSKSSINVQEPTFIGAMLFNSCTSGIRVVAPGKLQKINGYQFCGYGSHHNSYPHVYLTVAAAIGMTTEDVELTIKRLSKTLMKARKKLGVTTLEKKDIKAVESEN